MHFRKALNNKVLRFIFLYTNRWKAAVMLCKDYVKNAEDWELEGRRFRTSAINDLSQLQFQSAQ